jgi:hypothetical protein
MVVEIYMWWPSIDVSTEVEKQYEQLCSAQDPTIKDALNSMSENNRYKNKF